MRGNEWKLIVAFVVGAVLSFFVGMYLLGPLFVTYQAGKTEEASKTFEAETSAAPTLTENIPNVVYRSDVDSVSDHTAIIIERIQRPLGSEPEPFAQPQGATFPPFQPRHPIQQPKREPPSTPFEKRGEISEPVSPPTITQPPQPPVREPTTPPPAETRRTYRVRVGIFSQESNVKNMLETLTSQGYHPYVEEEEVSGNQKRYRIYVGALENRESAERLKQELAEKGIPSIIEEKQE